jgi:transcriptional regulator with XRE-family HTH domain/Zn-dependent peptidase ImmA (M78 family)
MSDVTVASASWNQADYQRFREARGEGHILIASFENGDEIQVDLRALLNVDDAVAKWETLDVDSYELRLAVDGETIEVPWLDVRALADERLAAHLADRAHEQARHVGHNLRLLRARRKLTAREVAERAGISAQSLSRIERGRHDVVFSTLQRVLAAMNLDLSDLAAVEDVGVDPKRVRAALLASGLDKQAVARVLHGVSDPAAVLARVRGIFGWSVTDLAGPGLPPVLGSPALAGRFKAQARERRAASTYIMYAHKVAMLADQAAWRVEYEPPPDDANEIAAQVRERYGEVRFESLLRYCWDHGIVVVPLADRGQFHGACWLIGTRPVIVLKQGAAYNSRWAFDLAHELRHVLGHLHPGQTAIIEFDVIGVNHDEEEREASQFAGELLLDDAEDLFQEVVQHAGGKGPRLKAGVQAVSAKRGVDAGVLANALAWRLDLQDFPFPFWSVANNLQRGDTDAPSIARRLLEEHLDRAALTDDDALVLQGGLAPDDEDEA